jgi:hypothetical protein
VKPNFRIDFKKSVNTVSLKASFEAPQIIRYPFKGFR